MDQKSPREDLERQLEQSRRLSYSAADVLTTERLKALVLDLERQLRETK